MDYLYRARLSDRSIDDPVLNRSFDYAVSQEVSAIQCHALPYRPSPKYSYTVPRRYHISSLFSYSRKNYPMANIAKHIILVPIGSTKADLSFLVAKSETLRPTHIGLQKFGVFAAQTDAEAQPQLS